MRLIDICDASMILIDQWCDPASPETYHLFLKRSICLRLSLCLLFRSVLLEFSLCLHAEGTDL